MLFSLKKRLVGLDEAIRKIAHNIVPKGKEQRLPSGTIILHR